LGFSNLFFLYILLPVLLTVYFLVPSLSGKNMVLLVFSLIFYAMGQPVYLMFMVGLSFLNFVLARKIKIYDPATVVVPLVLNLVVLFLMRYLDLILSYASVMPEGGLMMSISSLLVSGLNRMGMSLKLPTLAWPMGITLYTISTVSYLLDVYTGRIAAERKFRNLLLYLLMFPKLFQGPIVRYDDVAAQIKKRRHQPKAVMEGILRFLVGLAKLVILSYSCGALIWQLKSMEAEVTLVGVWYGAVLFLFQIYYELSGYADMAIGLGRIFGFRYGENFDRPYMARSIAQFLRRWNISLSAFLREYVYLPLGGSRLGKNRQLLNTLIVLVLTGLFYGGRWNYLLWGLYFFVLLVTEKSAQGFLDSLPDGFCRCATLWFILFGWILFSAEDLAALKTAGLAILGYGGMAVPGLYGMVLNSLPLLLICSLGCSNAPLYAIRIFAGICDMGPKKKGADRITFLRVVYLLVSLAGAVLLLWLCTSALVGSPAEYAIFINY